MSSVENYIIVWSSSYRGYPKVIEVFGPKAECDVAKEVLRWMLENGNGNCTDIVRDIMQDCDELNVDEDDEDSIYLINLLISQCNSVKDLKKICNKYNDSYYEDEDGWKLTVKKVVM